MPDTPFDYRNPAHYFRIAFASVRRHAEKKGLFFTFHHLEDLASQTLVRFYELQRRKKVNSAYAIPEIARHIVLEESRHIDPTVPLLMDDILASPLPSIETSWHDTALECLFATLTPTERKIADAFLQAGGLDPGRIAEIAGTSPPNVSKYLNKMRSHVGDALALFAYQAAIPLLADTPSDVYKKALLSFAQSPEHHAELQIRLGTAINRILIRSLTSYGEDPHQLVVHVGIASHELLYGLTILDCLRAKPVDPILIQTLSQQLSTTYHLAGRAPDPDLRRTLRHEIHLLKSRDWSGSRQWGS